jgi:DNA-damage-inducible protein J
LQKIAKSVTIAIEVIFMSSITVQSRVNPELKAEAEAVFASMGMSVGDAIRIFLQQSVNIGGLPFQPVGKVPNAETIMAIKELEAGIGEKFNNLDSLFSSWKDA